MEERGGATEDAKPLRLCCGHLQSGSYGRTQSASGTHTCLGWVRVRDAHWKERGSQDRGAEVAGQQDGAAVGW